MDPTLAADLKTVTEASPKIVDIMVKNGVTLTVDGVAANVYEVAMANKRFEPYRKMLDSPQMRSTAGVVVERKHLLVSGSQGGTESLIGHETGHLLDWNAGVDGLSSNKKWLDAWFDWKGRTPTMPKHAYDYFAGFNGASESFAEVYGHVITRGRASATATWGARMVDEMTSILKSIDPKIKIGN